MKLWKAGDEAGDPPGAAVQGERLEKGGKGGGLRSTSWSYVLSDVCFGVVSCVSSISDDDDDDDGDDDDDDDDDEEEEDRRDDDE